MRNFGLRRLNERRTAFCRTVVSSVTLMAGANAPSRIRHGRFRQYIPLWAASSKTPPGISTVAAPFVLKFGQCSRNGWRSAGRMRYSTVTRTGPRSSAIVLRYDRRRPMHRRREVDAGRRSVISTARSPRRRRSTGGGEEMRSGSPARAATSPHAILPSVRQPKNTVV